MPCARQWRAPTMGSAAQRPAHVAGCTAPWRHVKRSCMRAGAWSCAVRWDALRCIAAQCALNVAWCTAVRCMLHVAQCAFYVARCTVCVLCCTLRAARCTAVRFMSRCAAHRAFSSASVTVHLFHAGRSLRSDLGTDATDRSDPAVAERKTTQPQSRTAQTNKHANKHARRENKTQPPREASESTALRRPPPLPPRTREHAARARAHRTAPGPAAAARLRKPAAAETPRRECAHMCARAREASERTGGVVAAEVGAGCSGRRDRCSGDAKRTNAIGSARPSTHARDLSGSAGDFGGFFCALVARPAQHKQTNKQKAFSQTNATERPRASEPTSKAEVHVAWAARWSSYAASPRRRCVCVRACVRG
jgi:hypothetical protein